MVILRYWYDTEFIEDGRTIDLISIGFVDENGETFYAESSEVDWSKSNKFVDDWVRPHLAGPGTQVYMSRAKIAEGILDYFGKNEIELWSWFGAYDHVALAQLWGPMVKMPKGVPWFTHEIEQLRRGRPAPSNENTMHIALGDAFYHQKLYNAWI